MVTEQDYNNLANDVYNVENSKSDEIVKKKKVSLVMINISSFILKTTLKTACWPWR